MKTLLLSQRVNRMFKGTIDASIKLQGNLWFVQIFDTSAGADVYGDIARANPLLMDRKHGPLSIAKFMRCTDKYYRIKLELAKEYFGFADTARILSEESELEYGSWRRMLIAQSTRPVRYSVGPLSLGFGSLVLGDHEFTNAQELIDDLIRIDLLDRQIDAWDDFDDDD
ncbi:hypothetical protein CERZMDRAFT_100900 [Cercospora zeae-maydis SCOH1-5]|uniref:Uncharacterized protein n=1 Tax=Cercospora zeae-maydis SCOH1-5 TaxID=717836 RepID=A0A6A6F817_9PEZI|nr:hypothetical protein CERZMDRAFT_100900 [Cercospora zeae-maydis SCOH1-5]